MAPKSLLLLVTTGILVILQATADSDNVHCYAKVNEVTGECQDYLDEGVSDLDCCLNINYAFKLDPGSPCTACRPAEWSKWGEWTPCTVSCTAGVRKRERVCIGQGDCKGSTSEVESCSLQECCPKSGGWSSWESWSACSVTCEIGKRIRTRQCNNPFPVCGAKCPGKGEEIEECDTNQVCPTHGQWGSWGDWEPCSSTCIAQPGRFPIQSRFRQCDNPAPSVSPPGNPCPGDNHETKDCPHLPPCPIDGQWGAWQDDSKCSVTCGIGRIKQKRSCDNPAPQHGGQYCPGPSTRNIICNTKAPCPIDGTWSNWGDWTECKLLDNSKIRCTSRPGKQSRKRVCSGEKYGGKWCDGDEYKEGRTCYHVDKCKFKPLGTWSEWSEWGLCSSSCGLSERKRYRECLATYPEYSPIVQGAIRAEEVFFWGTPIFECEEINGQKLKVEESEECKNTVLCP